jgi:predicted MPP superfamily phosphohydrolase
MLCIRQTVLIVSLLLASAPRPAQAQAQNSVPESPPTARNSAESADLRRQSQERIAFLLDEAEKESSPRRRARLLRTVAASKGILEYLDQHPEAAKLYERSAATAPEAQDALRILESLRSIRNAQLARILDQRMALARANGDRQGLEALSEEAARYKWFGEIAMPEEYHDAPPVFNVTPAGKPIRVVAFGDFGTGQPTQIETAAAIRAYAKAHPLDFGITMGDNFYPRGMDSPSDPRWKTQWEDLYGPLGITFYPSLGNHDYGQRASPLSEILYSEKSTSWRFPARYYTFTAGAAQFFQLDTINLTERELSWLDEELAKSTAVWKIVYSHFQIYSATRGDNDAEQDDLVNRLLPILKKNKVELYICGHDHNLQILKPDGGVHFVVAGGGGAGTYEFIQKDYVRSVFKEQAHGFAILEADRERLTVRLVNVEGKELSALELKKDAVSARPATSSR